MEISNKIEEASMDVDELRAYSDSDSCSNLSIIFEESNPNLIKILENNGNVAFVNAGTQTKLLETPKRNHVMETKLKQMLSPILSSQLITNFNCSNNTTIGNLSFFSVQQATSSTPIDNLQKTIHLSLTKKKRRSSKFCIQNNKQNRNKKSTVNYFIRFIKNIRKSIAKLSTVIIEFFCCLGYLIQKGLTTLFNYRTYKTNDCQCDIYKNEINILKEQMKLLEQERNSFKCQIKIIEGNYDVLRQDVNQLLNKKQLIVTQQLLIPPPPPPPPPPSLSFKIAVKLETNKTNKKTNEEKFRPVITVEDIMKVKLKKPSERLNVRRSSAPQLLASELMDVKLRSTVPRQRRTPKKLKDCNSALSPNSNLTTLLNNTDTNVSKVKRLKRSNGYSFDDVCRKNNLFRRERLHYDD